MLIIQEKENIIKQFNYKLTYLKGLGDKRVYSTPSKIMKEYSEKIRKFMRVKRPDREFKFDKK